MSLPLNTEKKVEILFNKSFGIATTAPGFSIGAQQQNNASDKVIPKITIFTQEIPATAPTVLQEDNSFNRPMYPDGAGDSVINYEPGQCRRYTSIQYPYIAKYENFQLTYQMKKQSYHGKYDFGGVRGIENLLSQTIPFNYDVVTDTYAVHVKPYVANPNGIGYFETMAADGDDLCWYYDNDAGFITFYGATDTYLGQSYNGGGFINPVMDFWRYEGTLGLLGSTGSAGEGGGAMGATGDKGEIGPTGERGERGEAGYASLTGATGSPGEKGPTGEKGDKGDIGLNGVVGPTGPAGHLGTYANDMWMLSNLFGQPPPIQFGTPVSTSTTIYIPWSYPVQMRSGWVVNQWLPSITNFTASITPATGAIDTTLIPTDTSSKWIRDNINLATPYVTLLAIQKTQPAQEYAIVTYMDANGNLREAYAYQYYDQNLVAKLGNDTTVNRITARYSNSSTFDNDANNVYQTFNGFAAAGRPDIPRNVEALTVGITGPTGTASINITWSPPFWADNNHHEEGIISSYDISYNTTGSTIRYGGPAGQTSNTNVGSTSLSASLANLYPDASYSIAILATNNSGMTGPYSDPVTCYSGYLSEPPALSSISFNASDSYFNGSNNIYKVSTRAPIGLLSPLIKEVPSITTSTFEAPIHRFANRGNLQGGNNNPPMTLTAMLNGVTGPTKSYSGFPLMNLPSQVIANDIKIKPLRVYDYYSGQTADQNGFYLNASTTITFPSTGLYVGGIRNTLTAVQAFSNGITDASASTFFYYDDAPVTTAPNGSINAINISPEYFKKVSGVSVLYGTPIIRIDTSVNNMGSYFYRSPLITYKYTNNVNTIISEESTLNAVVSGIDISSDRFTTGSLGFDSSIISTDLANTYSTSITVDASASNIYSDGGITSKTINVITDGPSYSLAYSVQSIPTLSLTEQRAGFRIWSAHTVSNYCPDLSYNGNFYCNIPYDNYANLTSAAYETELMISNGAFTTPASSLGAYIDYGMFAGNPGLNYSTILGAAGTYRFASFCWKMPPSPRSFRALSFTIDSIFMPDLTGNNLLLMNNVQVPIFYAFQDISQPSIYNETTLNSGWINANSNNNPVFSGNFHLPDKKYGILGGIASSAVVLNGDNSATINVFIPAVNPVRDMVYLYLRIATPMDVNISFGAVSALIGA